MLLPTARELLVKKSLARLSLASYTSILVAGAGMDPYSQMFPDAERYVCFDIDNAHGNIDVQADAHSMPFGGGLYDCILATEILEHLREPDRFISEAYRVLRPGGLIIVTVPFIFHQHANPFDFNRPTKEALRLWFEMFEDVEISAQGNRVHSVSDLFSTAFSGRPMLQGPFILSRLLNHLFMALDYIMDSSSSTAPTGYLIKARKKVK